MPKMSEKTSEEIRKAAGGQIRAAYIQLEAFEIKLVKKGQKVGYSEKAFYSNETITIEAFTFRTTKSSRKLA